MRNVSSWLKSMNVTQTKAPRHICACSMAGLWQKHSNKRLEFHCVHSCMPHGTLAARTWLVIRLWFLSTFKVAEHSKYAMTHVQASVSRVLVQVSSKDVLSWFLIVAQAQNNARLYLVCGTLCLNLPKKVWWVGRGSMQRETRIHHLMRVVLATRPHE